MSGILFAIVLAGCGGNEAPGTCGATKDCPDGQYCSSGRCAYDCSEDTDCGDYALVCDDHGRCVPRGSGDADVDTDADSDADTDADTDSDTGTGTGPGCAGPSDWCDSAEDCCEGVCVHARSGTVCATGEGCGFEGDGCYSPYDCCSGNCTAGRCTRVDDCGASGDACHDDSDCCSAACGDGGRCNALEGCEPVGELCASGAECCSGLCSATVFEVLGRCQDGAGCSPVGEICGLEGRDDCCSSCEDGRCVREVAECRAEGELCFSAFDCCGNVCSWMDGVNRCCCI